MTWLDCYCRYILEANETSEADEVPVAVVVVVVTSVVNC